MLLSHIIICCCLIARHRRRALLAPPHEIVVGIVLGEARSPSFDVIVVFRCSDRFHGILRYPLFVAIVIGQVTSRAFVYYELGALWD